MEQEEHLIDISRPRFFTRSTARHLRRKRLHDARRAEKEQEKQENLITGVNVNSNEESIAEKDTNRPDVLTKSKSRRLRKKNKAQLVQNCCTYCESYCNISSPVIEPINDQEVIAQKDTENIRTITKSKARRLRKKNKTDLVQSSCSFCCKTYPSIVDPVLLNYIKTNEYDSECCASLEAEIVNSLKANHDPKDTVEEQVCHIQYAKKAEQTEEKPENIVLQKERTDSSCVSRPPGLVQFENEVQTWQEKCDESTNGLAFASQLKQKVEETIETRLSCTKKEPTLQRLDIKQFNELENLSNLQEIVNSTNFVRLDRNIELCNIESEKEINLGAETVSINPKGNITSYLEIDLEKKEELKLFSETNIKSTLSSTNELLKNVKNLQFNDSSEINALPNSVTESSELSSNSTGLQHKNSVSVIEENISASSSKVQLEAGLVSNSCGNNQNCSSNLNCLLKEVETTKVEASPVENTDRLSTDNPVLEKTDLERLASAPIKMTNKGNASEKSREEIKAEREAKKAAKALAKAKSKTAKTQEKDGSNDKSAPPDSIKNKQIMEKVETVTNENIKPNKALVVNNIPNTCVKSVAQEVSSEGKSKAELKAERRAKQEAQRAAKQQNLLGSSKVKSKGEGVSNKPVAQNTGATDTVKKVTTPKKVVQKDNAHEINLFKHLYHEREQATVDVPFVNSNIHPAIVRLGTQYASKVIVGSNARCVALLATVKQLIKDFERPSQADFIRGLEASLQESVAYLHHCRPLAVSMQNALRHLKWQMTQLPSALPDAEAKSKLGNAIDTYILEQIQLADKAISITIQTKISNGDVILTYGYSSLIHKILLDAHTAGKQFRVIVVDGRPWLEGKEQLRRLAKHGIECSYILINALSYVMPEVSKVFLGAHAILANGAVMSRVGTAQVALMARAFNIPVLVACETHKSCERVQTDSIVYNELGNADELARDCGTGGKKSLLANWKTRKSLNLLNITYDVTPADLVTAVVTELAILPCTSVPVILRIKPSEI